MSYKSIIYKITNKVNGKVYIGQSKYSLEKRFNDSFLGHFTKAFNTIKNNYFYNALRKYGKENFIYEVIEESTPRNSARGKKSEQEEIKIWLDTREKYWIAYYHSNEHDKGYNQTSGGQKDYKRTPEERERLAYQSKLNMARPGMKKRISQKCKALWSDPEYLKNWQNGMIENGRFTNKPRKKKNKTNIQIQHLNNNTTLKEAFIILQLRGKKCHSINKLKRLLKRMPQKIINLLHFYFIIKFGKDYRLKAFNETQRGKRKNIQRKLTPEQELERRRKISENNRWRKQNENKI